MENNNANLVRQLVNNSWNEKPITKEQAEKKIQEILEKNKKA